MVIQNGVHHRVDGLEEIGQSWINSLRVHHRVDGLEGRHRL